MSLQAIDGEARFSGYVEGLVSVIGHADRARPLRDYCLGLVLPCERKSVEPIAAVTAPQRTAAQHQSLLHFVGEGRWSDEKVLAKVQEMVLPAITRHGPIEAWIIDDTSFPKKGKHSVGVARQRRALGGPAATTISPLAPPRRGSSRRTKRRRSSCAQAANSLRRRRSPCRAQSVVSLISSLAPTI